MMLTIDCCHAITLVFSTFTLYHKILFIKLPQQHAGYHKLSIYKARPNLMVILLGPVVAFSLLTLKI
jgi:hypothetical protein